MNHNRKQQLRNCFITMMQFTTTTTRFILVAVIGTSAMAVMVQARAPRVHKKDGSVPPLVLMISKMIVK